MSAPSFLQVLTYEVGRLQAAHPEREGELARAHALILHGMVVPSADDPATGQVLSSDAQTVYRVNGTCTCRAGEHGTMCKHRQAWQLYQHITKKVEALPTPEVFSFETKNSPLFEAPASANCHITISGCQVQLTLRDRDEGRLLERLAVVLARYPAPQPPRAPASTQAGAPSKDWCAKHQVRMQRHENAKGVWYSHYVDGTHCKGRR
jgi:hypothetical protein